AAQQHFGAANPAMPRRHRWHAYCFARGHQKRTLLMLNRIGFALALPVSLLPACTDSADELATDDATVGDDAKADASGGTYTYYFVQPDLRACVSPVCGGVFYKLANGSSTTCLDGT